ncbi:MAG: DNA polymerase III subunit chi [Alphaproteobacteria bacterium]
MQISFYHLTRLSLGKSLPKLLEKVLQQNLRCVVVASTEADVQILNDQLWTYHPEGFLPHGTKKEGRPKDQPVWISTAQENPNESKVLVLTWPIPVENFDGFERIAYIFDGNKDDDLTAARSLWKEYNTPDHTLAYWQQDESGQWTQKG